MGCCVWLISLCMLQIVVYIRLYCSPLRETMSPHLVVGIHNVCVDQDGFMYASDLYSK